MQLVVLVGQRKAVGIAVDGIKGRRRWSKLKELLTTSGAAFAPPVTSRQAASRRHP
jgi:hypothetical protein